MFSGFDEASRDMTYFCVDPTWGRPPNTMTLFTFLPPHFGYVKKIRIFAALKFKKVRRVNRTDVTYGHSVSSYATAEEASFVMFTPPL